jgi:flagellar hook-associated protein 2
VAISFGGMASGLPPNLVDMLVEAERAPIKNLEQRKAKVEEKLGLVTNLDQVLRDITGTIGELASTKGFQDIKLTSGDANVVQGIVDPNVVKSGSWNVEVVDLAQKASAITNGFPDKDRTEIGVGYFRFKTNDGDKDVYISGGNSTLEAAANTINSAKVGVRATVVNDRNNPDNPYKLMLSGESVGGDSRIEYPTLYFLDGDQDLYFEEEKEAKNGTIKVDGFEFAVASNTVTDIIPGVTLELKQAQPGRSVNLTVKEDGEVVSGKVKGFVDAMNKALGFMQQQSRIDGNTDTTRTLGGDSLIRSTEQKLRTFMQSTLVGVGPTINRLSQLGIGFNRNGLLDFDQEKFNSTLSQNPDAVQRFFAGDGFSTGFIPTLKNTLSGLLAAPFGPVANRQQSMRAEVNRMNDRIAQQEKNLEKKADSLKRKFASLEEKMSKLKAQGGQLAAMGGGGGAMNLASNVAVKG